MNKEYEYVFKVKNVKEFIQGCIDNQYEKKEEYLQNRILYKSSVLTLEEQFARPVLEKRLVKSLKLGI